MADWQRIYSVLQSHDRLLAGCLNGWLCLKLVGCACRLAGCQPMGLQEETVILILHPFLLHCAPHAESEAKMQDCLTPPATSIPLSGALGAIRPPRRFSPCGPLDKLSPTGEARRQATHNCRQSANVTLSLVVKLSIANTLANICKPPNGNFVQLRQRLHCDLYDCEQSFRTRLWT